MTEPNQVRPIMKILNQVRELIIDAHNAGKAKGREEVVEWIEENCIGVNTATQDPEDYMGIQLMKWQAKLKKWGIE